jgi:hypothetical protein
MHYLRIGIGKTLPRLTGIRSADIAGPNPPVGANRFDGGQVSEPIPESASLAKQYYD